MIPSRILSIAAAAALIAFAFQPGVIAATQSADPTAEALAARAQSIIDKFDGTPEALDEAENAIKASLAKGMNSHALVERARLIMIRGDESPASLGMAKDVLYVATATDPTYDRIYVLQSYVALRMNDVATAGLALHKAEMLHPTDPWFKLNYALYYDSLGQMDKALKMREEVVASGTSNEGALRTAMQDLEHHYMLAGDRPGMDRLYKQLVARWPNEAYVRGNYARSVITQFYDYDAGERAAKEALAIMDYPHARQTVSLALYGRWAAAKRDRKDFTVVRALLDKARAYDPRASMVPTCALDSPRFVFLKDALLALEMGFDPTLHNC